MTENIQSSLSERSLPMMMAVLPTPAGPMSIAPCERTIRLSIQKLIEAVSPVGTVTVPMGVVDE